MNIAERRIKYCYSICTHRSMYLFPWKHSQLFIGFCLLWCIKKKSFWKPKTLSIVVKFTNHLQHAAIMTTMNMKRQMMVLFIEIRHSDQCKTQYHSEFFLQGLQLTDRKECNKISVTISICLLNINIQIFIIPFSSTSKDFFITTT